MIIITVFGRPIFMLLLESQQLLSHFVENKLKYGTIYCTNHFSQTISRSETFTMKERRTFRLLSNTEYVLAWKFTLLLLLVVPSAKCRFNGAQGKNFLSNVFKLPIKAFQLLSSKADLANGIVNQDDTINTVSLITAQGYHSETHEVVTKDGYILELHRIPYGLSPIISSAKKLKRATTTNSNRTPVILFHGLAQSSAVWVLNSPKDDALGFHLAEKGFDVWLANQRGTPYSARHIAMDPRSNEFWDYCTHEVGVFDLPAIIDYILKKTKQERVNFVGFSKANAAFLIMNSKKPEYNSKVGLAIFLAPAYIYYDGFYYGIPKLGAPTTLSLLEGMKSLMGTVPILPTFMTKLMHWVLPVVCHPTVDLFELCLSAFKLQHGHVGGLITTEKINSVLNFFPVPITLRTMIHMTQQMNFGEFTEYDYGTKRNLDMYGRPTPPPYNLTNVRTPIAVLVGPADIIGTLEDARTLVGKLPNLIEFQEINYPLFTHADFCFGDGAGKLVHRKVAQILQEFG